MSTGLSGSDQAFTDLNKQIALQVTQAGTINSSARNAAALSPSFGAFDEADQLYNAINELSVRLWLSTGTLQNSMDNLHSGTQDIQKNYSDTNNNLDFVANQLKNYDDYLNTAVVGGAGGA